MQFKSFRKINMHRMNSSIHNRYTLKDVIQLGIWVIRTRLCCPKAKLFCYPFDLRGKKYIDFGVNLSIGRGCRFDVFDNGRGKPSLVFGKDVQLNDYVHLVAMDSVTIGNNVLMASHIFISDNSHGSYKGDGNDSDPNVSPLKRDYPTQSIEIGDNSWICEGVMIMPGASIGQGCVIGAHSIVRGEIPDYTIAVGNPAKAIKRYNFNKKRWEKI